MQGSESSDAPNLQNGFCTKDDRERTRPFATAAARRQTHAPGEGPLQRTSRGARVGVVTAAARRPAKQVNDDINVLALVKGRERYIFLYEDSQRAEALRTLGRFASNPELSFTWYDAAVLSQKVRNNAPTAGPIGHAPSRRLNLPQEEA